MSMSPFICAPLSWPPPCLQLKHASQHQPHDPAAGFLPEICALTSSIPEPPQPNRSPSSNPNNNRYAPYNPYISLPRKQPLRRQYSALRHLVVIGWGLASSPFLWNEHLFGFARPLLALNRQTGPHLRSPALTALARFRESSIFMVQCSLC